MPHYNVTISVMLIVPDAQKALSWYKKALDATELWNLGGVAGLVVGGSSFYLHEVSPNNPSEPSPSKAGFTSVRVEVFVDDPDGLINRAKAAGATKVSPAEDNQRPWGTHRQGGFTDPFGHNWSVGDRSPLKGYPG